MNILQIARNSIDELAGLLHHTSQARMAAASRKREPLPAPRATRIEVIGIGMVRICDADTRRVLGWRSSYSEALALGAALERGEHLQHLQRGAA